MKHYKQVRYILGVLAQLLYSVTALSAGMAIIILLFGAAFPKLYSRTALELIEIAARTSLGSAGLLLIDTLVTIVLNYCYNRRSKHNDKL